MISAHPSIPEAVTPTARASCPSSRFLFLSSCPEPWGGSEELWSQAALRLSSDGHRVSVCKTLVVRDHPRIRELLSSGVSVEDYLGASYLQLTFALVRRILGMMLRAAAPRQDKTHGSDGSQSHPAPTQSWKQRLLGLYQFIFGRRLKALAPDLAVISQGENFDGLHFSAACRKLGVPYVLICQKASDLNWPGDFVREEMRLSYRDARRVYFVSRHNQALTERQIACKLPNAEVVRNPFLTAGGAPPPYPETASGHFRLACIARLFVLEKGQDSLLDVLAQEKWRRRDLEVNFYGQGIHREALERAAEMLDLRNVVFHGFTDDILSVWSEHHALVLPSRAEGLPLVVVEAMMCGRPPIVTNAGGSGEVVDDGETGFLARGTDAASLDDVLERAWSRRDEWEAIGREAAKRIRLLVPESPGDEFAEKLALALNQTRTEATSHGRL
ncbi:hypothetical protein CCAX7_32030 [Capsulimonas corticalis]|uniref:Uncharacterized protein n=1 Tax=Capsulimonas corticalis TaxID=2219043 RepID=A0A402D455_9BACT|nr:glycosyltransferase family 4 protein [Capsulimonas corticalis]BDI31152.1 hypothetical protein CCAX7_32030 [Capsulimonas corticalis]